jgi:hypothetical protein
MSTAARLLDTDEVAVYFRLYLLLYADDTVILAESAAELQANMACLACCTRCAFASLKEHLHENIIPRY